MLPNLKALRRLLLRNDSDSIAEIHLKLHALVITIDDFRAGPMALNDLVNGSRPSKFAEF